MKPEIIYVDKKSQIPLYGIDFIGVIDRGTNVIELKPLTLCNLKCKYCFVRAGDYLTNFIVDPEYIIEKVKEIVKIKGKYKIEIHLAPYGEILLYPKLFELIDYLWKIKGIEIISMQTNGLLLKKEVIENLERVHLTRINVSLNSLNQEKSSYLSNCHDYNINNLIENLHFLLNTNIDLLIAPVWFPGENDQDIEDVIKFIINLRKKGYSDNKIQIGIQKYLIYKTGRKLKKIQPKSWAYFYTQLTNLEKKYNIKLKLGPKDFGIHRRKSDISTKLEKNEMINLTVISKGRWKNEFIGKINDNFGVKILLSKSISNPNRLIGKNIKVKIIKANYRDNILTSLFSV
ncbi:MAG: radical SAM protein [Promethearchaeota archaeon]